MYAAVTEVLGPVFAKEAVEIARRKRFYVNRVLYGLVLFAILLAFADEYGGRLSRNNPQARREMSRAASELFIAVNVLQFAAVFAFVPLFTCAVLAGEREAHTLDLLFTTSLTDRQIVVGKLASRLVAMATLVLSGLPILSLTVFLGGVGPEALWRSAAVTLLATVFVGAHAVYFSAVTRSPLGALVRTYWWLALELIAIPAAVALVAAHVPAPSWATTGLVVAALAMANPVALFAVSLNATGLDMVSAAAGDWAFPAAFVLPVAWAAILIHRAVRRVRGDPMPIGLPAGLRALAVRAVTFWPRRSGRPRPRGPDGDGNPLWVRARRAAVYDREGHIRRVQVGGWLVAATFFLLVTIFDPRELRQEEMSMAFGGFAWAGVALLAVVLAGASLVGDRRRGFLDLLLVTPLTGREVIDGTLLAVWEHLRRVVWLPLVLAGVFSLTTASLPHGAISSVVTATLFLAVSVLHGVGCSLSARGVPAGLAASFAFPVAAIIGTAVLIGAFDEGHALVLWPLAVGLFVVGRWWTRRSATCAAVFCYLLGMHLVLASLATVWTTDFRRNQYPVAAMHAGFLTIVMLDDSFSRELRPWPAFVILPLYWSVLAVNFVWARRWLIRHFDRVAGRLEPSAGDRSPMARAAAHVASN